MNARILIIDDELVICKSCEKIFRRAGHDIAYTTSGNEALRMLNGESFDVVFTDLKMVEIGGMEVLQKIKQQYPDMIVIIITGHATIASAIETMRTGAFDYLPKPFTPAEILAVLDRALERRRITQVALGEVSYTPGDGFEGMIGKHPSMQEVYRLILKVAPTDSTVLIIGESGTGKDLVARAVHQQSVRKREKFSAIDLTTLSSTLLESELFGHVKGAFTNAYTDKQGLFEAAHHGTIFLDEIGNLSLEIQARLLRVLQEKEFYPVGSTVKKNVDVRLIFATNQNLKQLVLNGKFREDLYYRLNVFPIKLPPLRIRRDDIPELVQYFISHQSQELHRTVPKLAPDSLEALMNYHWPGNVRELEHTIERLMILLDGDAVEPVHIAAALFRTDLKFEAAIPKTAEELKKLKSQIRESSVNELEKLFVIEALVRNNWNITQAARDVQMQRSNFQALMRKHGVIKPAPSA